MKKAILCFPHIPSRQNQYPTGLYKIATFCKEYYDVIVLDQRLITNIRDEINGLLDVYGDEILCLGLTVITGEQISSAIKISETFHRKIKIVWGGMHPTILPEQTIMNDFVDYVIRGEGEEAFLNLLLYLDGKLISQEMFLTKENKQLRFNFLKDFNHTEYVDFEKYPIEDEYFVTRDGLERAFTVETSRGCPHNCFYCHNSLYKVPYRTISVEKIAILIEHLKCNYGIDGIVFQEDNLFTNPRRIRDLVRHLKLEEAIGWKANSRIDYFKKYIRDFSFMSDLVESGCKVLQFGIETGSIRMQQFINKKLNIEEVILINRELAKYPIRIRYNFIVGFPTETKVEIDETFKLIETLRRDNKNADPPFLNLYTPYPGTPLYQQALESGFVEPKNTRAWSEYNWNNLTVDWLEENLRNYLDKKSKNYFENSNYLRK